MVRKIKPKPTRSQKEAKKDLQQKLNMFDRLPDECLVCFAPFNKTDREMVTTWNVVVRNAEQTVRLYCPTCWQQALDLLQEYAKDDSRV